jgi:hypothetical protein
MMGYKKPVFLIWFIYDPLRLNSAQAMPAATAAFSDSA